MKSFSRVLAVAALAGLALVGGSYLGTANAASGEAPVSSLFDQDCCNN
ncbi:hypothetical protein ACIBI9_59880 [Nonomuraea sp. NPDC050451]